MRLVSEQLVHGVAGRRPINELDNQLYFLSQLKHLGSQAGKAPEYLSSVKSYSRYLSGIGITNTEDLNSKLADTFGLYQAVYLSLDKLILVIDRQGVTHTGLLPGEVDWKVVPDSYGRHYIVDREVYKLSEQYKHDKSIVDLVSSSVNRPVDERFLVHDTSSVGLVGIAREKSILSATNLVESGKEILSGEFMQRANPDTALFNVYASPKGITSGNITLKDLDQYVVSLIIGEKEQEETMRSLYTAGGLSEKKVESAINKNLRRLPRFEPLRYEALDGKTGEEARDMVKKKMADFRRTDNSFTPQYYESFLGPEVPLKNIKALAIPQYFAKNYKDWVKNNLPEGSFLLVREAAELLNTNVI